MTPISFKANYLKDTTVLERKSPNNYCDTDVSIVELDPKDKRDMYALGNVACKWSTKHSYGLNIYNDALDEKSDQKKSSEIYKKHFYAITSQDSNYKHLEDRKILGLAVFSEIDGPFNVLDWLQISPSTNETQSCNRKYKNLGTAIVNFIKGTSDKNIYVDSDISAIDFYKKNGFNSVNSKYPSKMMWNA